MSDTIKLLGGPLSGLNIENNHQGMSTDKCALVIASASGRLIYSRPSDQDGAMVFDRALPTPAAQPCDDQPLLMP